MPLIWRETDGDRINAIANHPSIFPAIAGPHRGPFDLTPIVQSKLHIVLSGDHGYAIFFKHQHGLYEAHTAVLPSGRGHWTREFGIAATEWMFTRTDAIEIVTKCPAGNVPAVVGARMTGAIFDFETRPLWPVGAEMVPFSIYSLYLPHWQRTAPGMVEQGEWFHRTLREKYAAKGTNAPHHEDDTTHDRYVGVAVVMMMRGQCQKAVIFYNRWAVLSGYKPASLISLDPVIVDIGEARLRVTGESFEVV